MLRQQCVREWEEHQQHQTEALLQRAAQVAILLAVNPNFQLLYDQRMREVDQLNELPLPQPQAPLRRVEAEAPSSKSSSSSSSSSSS